MESKFRYNSYLEAHLAVQLLNSSGIEAVLRGNKDYLTHVIGTDVGTFDIIVDSKDFESAQKILKFENQEHEEKELYSEKRYFTRALIFSVAAIGTVPFVFNYVALSNLKLFLSVEKNKSKRFWATLIILLLQIPMIFAIIAILKWLRHFSAAM